MKLDGIQDIEVLRELLKTKTAKCIKNFIVEGIEFKKGEYYFYAFDYEEQWYYVEYVKDKNIIVYDCDMEQYFEFPKEGD